MKDIKEWSRTVLAFMWDERQYDENGKLVCKTPIYPYLQETFGLQEKVAKRIRTRAVRRLTAEGAIFRKTTRGLEVRILETPAHYKARQEGRTIYPDVKPFGFTRR